MPSKLIGSPVERKMDSKEKEKKNKLLDTVPDYTIVINFSSYSYFVTIYYYKIVYKLNISFH